MKIALLTNYHLNYVGGAEEVLDRLAHLWHDAGHEVVLLSSPGRRQRVTREWRCAYRHVEIPRPFSTRLFLSRYVKYLAREQVRGRIDVLFASDTYWPGHVARLFHEQSGVPYVLCSHGSDVMHGSRFLKRKVCRERIADAIRQAAGIACISDYMRRRTVEIAAPRGLVRVIHNGWPDAWTSQPTPTRIVNGDYLFAMGRVIEQKGFQTLINAFAQLRSRHPQVSLIIAGEGPYRAALLEQAERLGLSPSSGLPAAEASAGGIYLPGLVQGETKRSLVRHATVGVCPSIRQEPQGLVLLEMLCAGVPVIGSNVGGIPEIVQPGVNGDIFEAQDAGQLAGCLDRLLSQSERRAALAERAAASIEHLRWTSVAERYLALFDEVIRADRPAKAA